MATGYGPEMTNDSGRISSTIRYYYSTIYDPATNTSTVTLTPQLYADLNWGNDIRMYGGSSNAGIRVDKSTLWPFTDGYSGSRHLYCTDCDWNNMYANTGATFSFSKKHDSNGNLSFQAGIVGTISGYGPEVSVYDWPTGRTISIHENRSLYVSYNANGGSGAPSATYFYGSTESITLSSTRPTRTGYTFLGWSTSSTATTATYSPGQNIGTRSSGLALYAVWEKKTFELSISEGTGSNIVVKRGSTTLSDGALITYGDELTITFTATSGYNLETQTVNGVSFTSGGTLTVTSDTSVVSTARLKTFTLTILQGANSSIAVMRENEVLSNGATITYGDELTISFSSPPEYELSTHTVNGSTFASGGKHTVTGAVSVASTASLKTFLLSISAERGANVLVKRGSSTLSDGATITYGDVIEITVTAAVGYLLREVTLNDGELVSPSVVRTDIRIEATAIPAGANIAAGEENVPYQFAIDTGSAYEIFVPVLDNGQSWELY